jgi:hypothetical protein
VITKLKKELEVEKMTAEHWRYLYNTKPHVVKEYVATPDPWFFWLMTGVLLGMGLMWVLTTQVLWTT